MRLQARTIPFHMISLKIKDCLSAEVEVHATEGRAMWLAKEAAKKILLIDSWGGGIHIH